MSSKADMHSLAQDILDSSEARSAGLAALREQAAATCRATVTELKETSLRRQAAAAQCRRDAERWRRDLVRQGEQLASSDGQRKAACQAWLSELVGARQSSTGEQRSSLARVHASLASEHSRLAAGETRRKTELESWLKGTAAARQERQREQRGALAQISSALAGAHTEIGKAELKRKSAAGAGLRRLSAERKEARQEWRGISATRQAREKAGAISPAAARSAGPKGGAPRGQAAVETVQALSEAPATTSDTGALRDQVFQFLANHPDGTKLVDLAQQFGLAHVQMARIVRTLLDDNKVEKRDLLYFAI